MVEKDIEEMFNKGQRLRQVYRDFRGAIECYDFVISRLKGKKEKLYPWACFEKGNVLNSMGRFTEAIAAYQEVIAFSVEDNQEYYWAMDRQAIMYRKLGLFDKSLEMYDRILALNPGYHEAWTGKGETYEVLEKLEDAKSLYLKAIELGETKWAPPLLEKLIHRMERKSEES
jgi:tetratricopeptide (TPR) repeat protein